MAKTNLGSQKKIEQAHKKAVSNISGEFLECRTLMHAWKYTSVLEHRGKGGQIVGFTQGLQCQRCRTDKYQEISAHGEIVATKYAYPDGYLLAEGVSLNAEDRASLRLRAMSVNS